MDWAAMMPSICRWQAFRSCHCHLQIGTHQGHCQRLNNKSICHLPLGNWNPCCYSCWLSTTWSKFRVEWGTHFVLQGIWWDRPLNNWMFLEQMLRSLSLHLLISTSVQSLSRVQLFVTPWTAARQASLSITNSQSLFKLMSIESVMPSNHLILCCPLLLLPSIFPSIRVFSNESVLRIRWPKYLSFSFNISPSNEYLGLISFRMDWLDRLAVQGTLKSLL